VGFKHPALLQPVLDYALAIKATSIDIEGHQGAALLSDGTVLNESPQLAQRRAQQVAELLQGAGLIGPRYTVRWIDAAPAPSGSDDSPQRRVDITVKP
jgi:outer membrane protein OmpA-like peptidoglycan-associated protein